MQLHFQSFWKQLMFFLQQLQEFVLYLLMLPIVYCIYDKEEDGHKFSNDV